MFLRCTLRHCPHGLVILVMSTYVDLMALITWSVLKLETRDSDCSCAARRLRQHVLRDWRTGLNVGEWLKTNKNNNLQRVPRVHQSLTCIFWPDDIGGSHLHRLGSQCFLAQGAKTLAVGQGATTSHGAKLWITFSFIIRYYQSLYVPLEPTHNRSLPLNLPIQFIPVQCHAIHRIGEVISIYVIYFIHI